MQIPPVQTPLRQSVAAAHESPSAQGEQPGPPQSWSVSVPFLTPSRQLGAMQSPSVHTPLRQSEAAAHSLPSAHDGQLGPPQSTSVSVPFRRLSVQFGVSPMPGPVSMVTLAVFVPPRPSVIVAVSVHWPEVGSRLSVKLGSSALASSNTPYTTGSVGV
jgi:hypothetical protein